jgi:hypothetical protein
MGVDPHTMYSVNALAETTDTKRCEVGRQQRN